MQTGGGYLKNGGVKTAIFDLADIRGLVVNELMVFEPWLAKKTSEWRERYIGD